METLAITSLNAASTSGFLLPGSKPNPPIATIAGYYKLTTCKIEQQWNVDTEDSVVLTVKFELVERFLVLFSKTLQRVEPKLREHSLQSAAQKNEEISK